MVEDEKVKIEKFDGQDFGFWKMQIESKEVTPTFVQRQTKSNDVGGVGLIRSADTRSDNVVIGKECSLQHFQCEDYS